MIPTGAGVVGMKIETPDGRGVVKIVHNQDNVTVELEGKTVPDPKTGKQKAVIYVGDVSECNAFCEKCGDYHSFNKHTKKETASV